MLQSGAQAYQGVNGRNEVVPTTENVSTNDEITAEDLVAHELLPRRIRSVNSSLLYLASYHVLCSEAEVYEGDLVLRVRRPLHDVIWFDIAIRHARTLMSECTPVLKTYGIQCFSQRLVRLVSPLG